MANPSQLLSWTNILNEGGIGASANLPVIPEGNNRLVFIAFFCYNGASTTTVPTSVASNSRAAHLVIQPSSPQNRLAVGVYAFLEEDIAAISGQILTSTGGTGTQKSILVSVWQNAQQDAIYRTGIAYASSAQTLTIPLQRDNESATIGLGWTSLLGTQLPFTNPSRSSSAALTSGRTISWGSQNDTSNLSNFVVTGSAFTNALAINFSVPLAHSITNVNDGEPVIPGVRATWEPLGYSPAPNAAMLDGVACVDVDADGFTPSGYMDSAKNPRPGNRTLTATNGTQSANATVPVGVIAGYKYVQLVTVGSGSGFIAKGMNVQPGWFITYPDAHGNNVTDSGMFQTNFAGTQVFWAQNGDTGYGLSYNVITGPGGEIIEVSRSLTAKSLTMSGLTMRSLTTRGL